MAANSLLLGLLAFSRSKDKINKKDTAYLLLRSGQFGR